MKNTALRTAETWKKYCEKEGSEECFMCQKPPKFDGNYTYWKEIANQYPYDVVSDHHVLLVPRRHIPNEGDLNDFERQELETIRQKLNQEAWYDSILENFTRARSAPGHFHYHLLRWKRTN